MLSNKKETMYLPILLTVIPPRGFDVCLHDLVLSCLLSEPASDCRKANKGWGCVEKVL